MPYPKAFAFPRADMRCMYACVYACVEEGLMCSGDTDHFKPTLCPSTSSFQDFSMVRPLSPLSPISQYLRSSGGRRGIPNMLKVCSLTSSSWALVTSWESREGGQPGTPPTFGAQAPEGLCVHTRIYMCAWHGMNRVVITQEKKLHFCLQEGPWVEGFEGTSLTRMTSSRGFLTQNRVRVMFFRMVFKI